MNDVLRELIDHRWQGLEAERTSGERRLRVSELPVDTATGRLSVAVDYDGHRHVLVPISSHQKVRRGMDGPVLLLRRRRLEDEETHQSYADLSCLRADLNDLFTLLCADVLQVAGSVPDNPIKALYRVLDRWKALFYAKGPVLGSEQLAGLFSELTVLLHLLDLDSSAHRLWRGPSGQRHDFASDTRSVEVKASMSGEGRRVRIHGLDQLEPPSAGTLHLAWYRLARSGSQGESVVDLVGRVLGRCDDESALLGLLAQVGYRAADIGHYREVRFSIAEERWYEVDAGFPSLRGSDLVAAGIPITVLDVAYTIDLSTEPPNALDRHHVDKHLKAMIEEHS